MTPHKYQHGVWKHRFMGAVAASIVAFSASLMAGCDSLFWGTDLDLDSTGGVNVGVNLGGPYGSGSLSFPFYPGNYNPVMFPPYNYDPFFSPGPVIVPPRPRPQPPLRPSGPSRPPVWSPSKPGNIGFRPSVLPGGTRPGNINGGNPGPVILPGQYRPGGNVRQ